MLPSESESAKLEHLSSMYLNNNQLTGREPFYVPKFLLELPRYQSIYIYLCFINQCPFLFYYTFTPMFTISVLYYAVFSFLIC